MSTESNIVILCDNREQRPLHFGDIPVERTTLATADYSIRVGDVDYRERVAIERKSVSDLLGCIGGQRERFEREMVRLAEIPFRALVVEGALPDLFEAAERSKIHPRTAISSVLAWGFKYHLPTLFASNRAYAAAAIRCLLRHGARYAARDAAAIPRMMFAEMVATELQPVRWALVDVVGVLQAGKAKHPDGDGFRATAGFHVDRARQHLDALAADDGTDDHLSHACCRLLMALQARAMEKR